MPFPASFARIRPAVPAIALAIALGATACSYRSDTNSGRTQVSVQPVGQTTGLLRPASARYDSAADVYYVSGTRGDASARVATGYIAVVSADSFRVILTLVRGGRNEIELDAPKGLALAGDTLWVADRTVVRAFDKHDGHPLEAADLAPLHARSLHDVVIGGDGAIYVTDPGTADSGGVSGAGSGGGGGGNVIYRVADGRATVALATPALEAPNGIAWDATHRRFLLAPRGRTLLTWTPGDPAPKVFASGPGAYDGIELLADGRVLVTSSADSTLYLVQNAVMNPWINHLTAPTDIGIDTRRNIVAVPRFLGDKVQFFRIPAIARQ